MSSTYTANAAEAYERLMGRWSPLLAEALIGFAGLGRATLCSISAAAPAAWR